MENNAVALRQQLTQWLTKVIATTSPEDNISVFGIGIVEVEGDFQLYLFGANRFDENSSGWAITPEYKASGSYLSLRQSGAKFSDWQDCLVNVLSAISVALSSEELSSTRLTAIPFFVGFDDGDLHRIR